MAEKVQGQKSYLLSIEKTYGQPISHWMDQLETVCDAKHMEHVSFLKTDYGVGHGYANALVAVFRSERGL